MSAVQDASCRASAADYLANGVPAARLNAARRDGYHLFLLMRTLMDELSCERRGTRGNVLRMVKFCAQNTSLNDCG